MADDIVAPADIVAFVNRCIDEDERVAKAVRDRTPWRYNPAKYWRGPFPGYSEESVFTGPAGPDAISICGTGDTDHPEATARATHIARWDPARVLAEVQAKRALIDQAAEWIRYEPPARERHMHDVAAEAELGDAGRLIIRLLAAPYAGQSGFDPSWLLET